MYQKESKWEKDLLKAIDEMDVYHVGGIFNGDEPVRFESEIKAMEETMKPVLKKELPEFVRSAISTREKEIAEEVEKMKKNLVVDNWVDGKPQNCNPRCHDSGKEEVIDKILQIIKH